MNILIVDDHPLFRHALIQAVRYSLPQAQIQETADVDEFYARLEHGAEPDLVLLDLNLPGASGFSALVYVRAQYPAIRSSLFLPMRKCRLSSGQLHTEQWDTFQNPHTQPYWEAIKQVLEGEIWLPPNLPTHAGFDPRAADETALAERLQSPPHSSSAC